MAKNRRKPVGRKIERFVAQNIPPTVNLKRFGTLFSASASFL